MTPPSAAAAPAVRPGARRSPGRLVPAPGRPLTAAPRPRRVSGPARRPQQERSARRRSAAPAGIVLGLIEAVSRLSEHRLLDRLIRGRIWIALVAFALIGIVTLQLGLLKLNAGIGRTLQREAALQRENAALSIESSELAAGNLVESSAARLGMEVVPPGALRFLSSSPRSDAGHGAAALATSVGGSSSATGEAPSAEASSSAESSSSTTSGSGEGSSGSSSESQASSASSRSESESAGRSSSESSESSGSAAARESSGEASGPASSTAPPSTGSGSAGASGGTGAGTSGR
jgi:hypothetical protein